MAEASRRRLLMAGGAIGAAGALGFAAPARARSPWTWKPAESVAGRGTGADPQTVWDPEVDALVASLIERGDVPRVNEALRTWTRNGQPVPTALPTELRDFVERARRLPPWADHGKLATAFEFNKKRGTYLGVLYGLASGMMSTVIPREARAVYYSAGGADMKDRISKTAKLGYDVGTHNAFAPDGEMIVTCVKTRLVHAAVRHLLPHSSHWRDVADEQVPISQRDMMVTWHSLPTTVMQKLRAWKVPIPTAEGDAFLHSWQLTAHLLGIQDEYIPATWAAADAQAEQVLQPLLGPTREGVKLADILLNLAQEVDGAVVSRPFLESMTRYLLGPQVADWLEIPRNLFMDEFVRVGFPAYIAFKEGTVWMPLAPEGYWTFDEFLRQGALFFLSEGKPISIEIPTGNNPHYGS